MFKTGDRGQETEKAITPEDALLRTCNSQRTQSLFPERAFMRVSITDSDPKRGCRKGGPPCAGN